MMDKESRLLKDDKQLAWDEWAKRLLTKEECTNAYLDARFIRGETVGQRYLSIAQAQDAKSVKAIIDKMKRTVIGEERSVPSKTEVWFLFKDEYEALKLGV